MANFIDTSNPDYIAGKSAFREGGSMREAFNRSITNPEGDYAFMIGFSDGVLDAMRKLIGYVAPPRPR